MAHVMVAASAAAAAMPLSPRCRRCHVACHRLTAHLIALFSYLIVLTVQFAAGARLERPSKRVQRFRRYRCLQTPWRVVSYAFMPPAAAPEGQERSTAASVARRASKAPRSVLTGAEMPVVTCE